MSRHSIISHIPNRGSPLVVATLALLAILISGASAFADGGYGDVVDLHIKNGDTKAATFKVVLGFGSNKAGQWPEQFNLQPGQDQVILFNHNAGSFYDGKSINVRVHVDGSPLATSFYCWKNGAGDLHINENTGMHAPSSEKSFKKLGAGPYGGGE